MVVGWYLWGFFGVVACWQSLVQGEALVQAAAFAGFCNFCG